MGNSEGLAETDTSVAELTIIDVREKDEWESGHVPEALHLPVGSVQDQIASLVPDKSAKIRVYCAAGRRAEKAKQTMLDLGYSDVRNLGGFSAAETAISALRK
jgi:rhodanese-related sulfurtransferase